MDAADSGGLTWDIWVRLFHWTLVLAVGFQVLSGLTGFEFFDWHRNVGELVLTLVLFRLLWGIVGSRNARLAGLVSGPRAVLQHVGHLLKRDVPAEPGHNAAGGWAVLAMLAIVSVQAVTGLFIADEDEFIEGALYSDVASSTAELLYRVHKINANLLEAIVILHIAMIAFYWIWGRRNLVVPMITGRMQVASAGRAAAGPATMRPDGTPDDVARGPAMWLKGAACALLAALAVGLITGRF